MEPVSDPTTIAAGSRLGKMESRVANSGHGLFTSRRIREGRTVGEYFGDRIEKDFDYGGINDLIAAYSMGNHDKSTIYCAFSIARNVMLCKCGYINDPLDDDKCNVRAVWRGNRCYIVATRDIEAGEELLMAYGDTYWMRDCWDSHLIKEAWENYGLRRTDHLWRAVYHRRLVMEQQPDEHPLEDIPEEEERESEVVFRTRIIIDLTQGDEAVVTEVNEPVAPLVPPDVPPEPTAILLTYDSPEVWEDYTIIRNSCA